MVNRRSRGYNSTATSIITTNPTYHQDSTIRSFSLNQRLKSKSICFKKGNQNIVCPIRGLLTQIIKYLKQFQDFQLNLNWGSRTASNLKAITDNKIQNLQQKKVVGMKKAKSLPPFSLAKKADGWFGRFWNLKKLNGNTQKVHFKIETMMSILKLITPNIYFTKIELKNSYYVIAISQYQLNTLSFQIKESCTDLFVF